MIPFGTSRLPQQRVEWSPNTWTVNTPIPGLWPMLFPRCFLSTFPHNCPLLSFTGLNLEHTPSALVTSQSNIVHHCLCLRAQVKGHFCCAVLGFKAEGLGLSFVRPELGFWESLKEFSFFFPDFGLSSRELPFTPSACRATWLWLLFCLHLVLQGPTAFRWDPTACWTPPTPISCFSLTKQHQSLNLVLCSHIVFGVNFACA